MLGTLFVLFQFAGNTKVEFLKFIYPGVKFLHSIRDLARIEKILFNTEFAIFGLALPGRHIKPSQRKIEEMYGVMEV